MRQARGIPLDRSALEAVLAPVERARPLPARAYVDAEVFAFERSEILARAWICVGREDDVALPGQFVRETVAGEPVLVVRGADLSLRALFDVCRHRGASVVSSDRRRASQSRSRWQDSARYGAHSETLKRASSLNERS